MAADRSGLSAKARNLIDGRYSGAKHATPLRPQDRELTRRLMAKLHKFCEEMS